MLENLILYLKALGIEQSSILISNTEDGNILISTNEETLPKVIEQLDRNEKYPVIMNGVKVVSKVVSQTDTSVTVELTPVFEEPKIVLV